MIGSNPRLTRAALLVAAGLAAAGCATKIDVVQYPPFQAGRVEVLAVWPMINETPHVEAAGLVTDALATTLRRNGAYRVVGPDKLREMLKNREPMIESLSDPDEIAAMLRKLKTIDAFVLGSVEMYQTEAEFFGGRKSYWKYTANVTARMGVFDVADGKSLYATDSVVWGRVFSAGDPPEKPYSQLKTEAIDQLVDRLTKRIAPTRRRISIDRGKALRTANAVRDGVWSYTATFTETDPALYAVIDLPDAADGNRFRIRVVPKGQYTEAAGGEVLWHKDVGTAHLKFDPGRIVRRSGAGRYQLQMMSGAKPAVTVNVKIVAASDD